MALNLQFGGYFFRERNLCTAAVNTEINLLLSVSGLTGWARGPCRGINAVGEGMPSSGKAPTLFSYAIMIRDIRDVTMTNNVKNINTNPMPKSIRFKPSLIKLDVSTYLPLKSINKLSHLSKITYIQTAGIISLFSFAETFSDIWMFTLRILT